MNYDTIHEILSQFDIRSRKIPIITMPMDEEL